MDSQGRPTKQFTRKADVARHYNSTHERPYIDCPKANCSRKMTNGFRRIDHLIEHLHAYHGLSTPKLFGGRTERSTIDADPRSKNQVELTYSGLQDTKLEPELQDCGQAFQEASVHFGLAEHTSQNKEYREAYFGPPEDSNQVKSVTLANMVLTENELAAQLNLLKVNQRY
jgi:hypothetical protein